AREELLRRILLRSQEQGRGDDNEHTVRNRLQVFDEATRPLVEYYRGRGLLHVIDAARDEATVTTAILDSLGVG
ncbi:MAG: adenylate kinase, partial [Jatrophihabitantaceae bacterium]